MAIEPYGKQSRAQRKRIIGWASSLAVVLTLLATAISFKIESVSPLKIHAKIAFVSLNLGQ
ncbi:MAG: hypothetical protein D6728_12520 [Cyanobacteria bacterium J055]|nr:MAG: hypothetical protein D6728_12520 [Cyanobacteria bacterium J055]